MNSHDTSFRSAATVSLRSNLQLAVENKRSRVKDVFRGKCRVAMCQNSRLLYLRLPKCGNSSVISALDKPELRRLRPDRLLESFPEWHSFTFVRNPWDRLASTYRQKVSAGATTSRLSEGVYEGFQQKKIPIYAGMNFSEFCELVCSFADEVTDKHLQSQSHTLMHNGAPVVKTVGRFETISEDWQRIAEKAGIPERLPFVNESNGNNVHYRDYYRNNYLVNLVGDRYADDIRNFNYVY